MHAVRREIHTARHGRVVRVYHLYVFECTKAYKATKRFALSNGTFGRQVAYYLFNGTDEFRQATVRISVLKQKNDSQS
jgi:hypothetical protein